MEASRAPNIKKYSPHAKQELFHRQHHKKKLYIGGNRSGKTYGGITEAIWRASCTHPYRPDLNAMGPTRGRVVGVDFNYGVEKILLPLYKQFTYSSMLLGDSWDTAWDKNLKTLTFKNGSTIEFMSYDQDLDKFAGTSRHWIHFDEEPPKPIYQECLARLIDTNGDFWITMTPVEGITWVYDDLYEKNVDKPIDTVKVLVIEINSLENPYLSDEGLSNFVEGADADDLAIRVGGKFVQQGGKIWKNFDPVRGGRHVLHEPIDNPKSYFKNWLWIMCLDHGLNNPTAVLWIALDKNGFGVVFDEHYRSEWTVDQHAEAIILKIKEHGRVPDLMVADPSIAQRNGVSGTSIQTEYQKYGLSFILGNNDVKTGLIRVKRYWNLTKYIGVRNHPLFVDQNDAAIDKFPRLRVTPNCPNLIKEAKRYRWKTYRDKRLAYENNPYDEPHKKDDHTCDALRYGLMTQPDLFAENDNEPGSSEFHDRVNSALDKLGVGMIAGEPASGIADPMGLHEEDNPWREGFSLPNESGGGWTYDEHMGGIM
jgi:phage terminase large subunit-like protein